MKSNRIEIRPELFLRAPFYPFQKFDLSALPEVLGEQHFRNAIFLASPEFYDLIQAKAFDFTRLDAKAQHTLAKYFNRMCFRPTPFGSFASFTLLNWADGGPAALCPEDEALLTLLPDRAISADTFHRLRPFDGHTILRPNPTLYPIGADYRYIRSAVGPKGRFEFTINQEEGVAFNRSLLSLFGQGDREAGQITDWILKNADCTPEEAADYLRFFIEDQVLFTPGQGQIIQTAVLPAPLQAYWAARKQRRLKAAGDLSQDTAPLQGLFRERQFSVRKAYYYAALERPLLQGGAANTDREELTAAMHALHLLSVPLNQEALSQFKNDFRQRFELEKVPLLLALDPDTGVAYEDRMATATGGEILQGLGFPAPAEKNNLLEWHAVRQLFIRLWLADSGRAPSDPIRLTDEDLNSLPQPVLPQPPTLAVLFRKTAGHLVIEQAAGASATQLIGRFSVFSDAVHRLCRELAEEESQHNPEVIFADIGQLSDSYIDNINRRRQIYPFEIPVNSFSALPGGQQIALSELSLRLLGDELIMEQAGSGKRVIPRLASAYNFKHNELALFRFLCDLQFQGIRGNLNFDLMRLFPGLGCYPRVTYKKTVLSPAKWFLGEAEIASLLGERTAAADQLKQLCREKGIPPRVSFGEGDQQLVVDLQKPAEAGFFLKCLTQKSSLILQEYCLPDRSVTASGKALAGQYVAFLKNLSPVYTPAPPAPRQASRSVKRQFTPGSDWLYVKIYCTKAGAGTLLQQLIGPVMKTHRKRIRLWFFIRYADPRHHIRLRLRVKGNDIGPMLVALNVKLKNGGQAHLVSDMVCDTYRRKLERYGPEYMELAERIFHAGSELVIYFDPGEPSGDDLVNFCFGFNTARQMIRVFYPGAAEAARFTEILSKNFLREFGADKNMTISLDKKFRAVRARLPGFPETTAPPDQTPDFHAAHAQLLTGLSSLERKLLTSDPERRRQVLADVIHMQLNRTFVQSQRQQELLVYYFLTKLFTGDKARHKTG